MRLAKGEISVLKYTVTPADATVSALVWTTSDATVEIMAFYQPDE